MVWFLVGVYALVGIGAVAPLVAAERMVNGDYADDEIPPLALVAITVGIFWAVLLPPLLVWLWVMWAARKFADRAEERKSRKKIRFFKEKGGQR